jgi:hypothetical protein
VDRGKQADLEIEALDRGPGRAEENGLRLFGIAERRSREKFRRDFAHQKEDEVHQ